MNARLSGAPDRTELCIVFGLTVGLPLLLTLSGHHAPNSDFGQRRLLTTLIAEILVIAALGPWLASRGWSFLRIAGSPMPADIARGLGIAGLAYVVYYFSAVTWLALAPTLVDGLQSVAPRGVASPWVVVGVCLINPVFEEFLWLAYGITALAPFGIRNAVLASVVFRTAIHAYQGLMAIVGILPLALVFTIYYARTRRLWPVVVAHMLFDAVGLLSIGHG